MRPLDVAVIVAYCVAVAAVGVLLGGRQRDSTDYFLGRHGLPWWAILLSIVATETSALTVISVPGLAATGNLTFIQLAFGYLVGRIGVAALLLPGYFEGAQDTASAARAPLRAPRAARSVGRVPDRRCARDAVRVFATAIPLAIITHWSIPAGILATGIITLAYTWLGGIRAVVWTDILQLGVYILGGVATLIVALDRAGGVSAFGTAYDQFRLVFLDFSFDFTHTYTLWSGLHRRRAALGRLARHRSPDRAAPPRCARTARRPQGAHRLRGVHHLPVRSVPARGHRSLARRRGPPGRAGDQVYPGFVATQLPAGLAGLVVAGLLAAAMGTHASAINSLASASTNDFYAPLTGQRDPTRLLKVGRAMTLVWAVVLVAGAMLFPDRRTPVVELALQGRRLAHLRRAARHLPAGRVLA